MQVSILNKNNIKDVLDVLLEEGWKMTVNELTNFIQGLKSQYGENEVGLSEIVITDHDKGMSATLGCCVEKMDWYDGEFFIFIEE